MSVRELCELAAEQGLLVDMHCDETDDPLSRHVETLAAEAVRRGVAGDAGPGCAARAGTGGWVWSARCCGVVRVSGRSGTLSWRLETGLVGRPSSAAAKRGRGWERWYSPLGCSDVRGAPVPRP